MTEKAKRISISVVEQTAYKAFDWYHGAVQRLNAMAVKKQVLSSFCIELLVNLQHLLAGVQKAKIMEDLQLNLETIRKAAQLINEPYRIRPPPIPKNNGTMKPKPEVTICPKNVYSGRRPQTIRRPYKY